MHRYLLAAVAVFAAVGLLPTAPTHHVTLPVAQAQPPAMIRAVVKTDAPPTTGTDVKPIVPTGQQPQPQPAPAPKAPVLTLPDEVHVAPGELAQVLIQTEPGVQLHYQWVGPKGGHAFREYDPDPTHVSYQVLGRKPGTFYLVVFAVKDGQVAKATCTITIDAPPAPVPPVPPVPPAPGPTPPAPADPLTAQLQTLYSADAASPAEKLPVKTALATLYGTMAQQLTANQYATLSEANDALKAAAAAAPLGTYLIPLRKACAAEVAGAVGPAPAAKLEPALRAKLAGTFARLATSLNAVK